MSVPPSTSTPTVWFKNRTFQSLRRRFPRSCRHLLHVQGSLTVVCEHGATLRDSWAIDDSSEVGRLVFGASLDYDAVRLRYLGVTLRFCLFMLAVLSTPSIFFHCRRNYTRGNRHAAYLQTATCHSYPGMCCTSRRSGIEILYRWDQLVYFEE